MNNLQFIKEKIENLGVAIFKTEGNSLTNLPNNIVSTLKVDSDGFVWFVTYTNKKYKALSDSEYLVKLNYHKKGVNYDMDVEGKGIIVNDKEEILRNYPFKLPLNTVLMKVKIFQAQYIERKITVNNSFNLIARVKSVFYDLMHPAHATGTFNPSLNLQK
jgi:hypothetical protein